MANLFHHLDRIEEKILPEPITRCWLWMGCVLSNGYGQVSFGGRPQGAHRVLYEEHLGPIDGGLVLDHLCRQRCCVNPAHLDAVTHHENVLRGEAGITQSAKTHCDHGHEFSSANTYRTPEGWRRCRRCRKEGMRRSRAVRMGPAFAALRNVEQLRKLRK